jgi:TPR repeat protein
MLRPGFLIILCIRVTSGFTLRPVGANDWFSELFSHCVFDPQPFLNSRRFPNLTKYWEPYTSRDHLPTSPEIALDLKQAAARGNCTARFSYGICRCVGFGATRSESKALKHWEIAVRQGFAEGRCFYALALRHFDRVEEAIEQIKQGVRDHDITAEFMYSEALLFGKGVTPNPAKAVKHLKRAAAHGYAPAILALGVCAAQGIGAPVDLEQALALFARAAEMGDAVGPYMCGLVWLFPGFLKNWENAIGCFKAAAEMGYTPARGMYARMLANGQGVRPDVRTACRYAQAEFVEIAACLLLE